jgi:hypothetical protein
MWHKQAAGEKDVKLFLRQRAIKWKRPQWHLGRSRVAAHFASTHSHTYTNTHTRTHTHTYTYTHTYTRNPNTQHGQHTYMHTHTHTDKHKYTHTPHLHIPSEPCNRRSNLISLRTRAASAECLQARDRKEHSAYSSLLAKRTTSEYVSVRGRAITHLNTSFMTFNATLVPVQAQGKGTYYENKANRLGEH